MKFNKEKIVDGILLIAKIISFLSLLMTVVIKTRILLGLKNPSEEWKKDESDKKSGDKDSLNNESY